MSEIHFLIMTPFRIFTVNDKKSAFAIAEEIAVKTPGEEIKVFSIPCEATFKFDSSIKTPKSWLERIFGWKMNNSKGLFP